MRSIIDVHNLSKTYRLGEVGVTTLRDDLIRFWAWIRGRKNPFATEANVLGESQHGDWVQAISDISFSVAPGERVGIIGKNGAGKSTLLKILTRITAPTDGEAILRGRMAALLEVGTGFHPEFTGRENIYMNGLLLGMSRKEVDLKLDEIVEFSGVGRYLDTPVKRYSSGMRVRLGFAVAAHLEPEILIVDEVLAVGDAEFQSKAIGKMQEVSNRDGRTILFVSHNMNAIHKLCTRCIVLEEGKVTFDGNVNNGIEQYLRSSQPNKTNLDQFERTIEGPKVQIESVELLNKGGAPIEAVQVFEECTLRLRASLNEIYPGIMFTIAFVSPENQRLGVMAHQLRISPNVVPGGRVQVDFKWRNQFSPGVYGLVCRATSQSERLDRIQGMSIEVRDISHEKDKNIHNGTIQLEYEAVSRDIMESA